MPRMLYTASRSGLGCKALVIDWGGAIVLPPPLCTFCAHMATEFSWRQMQSPEELYHRVVQELPIPRTVKRFLPNYSTVVRSQTKEMRRKLGYRKGKARLARRGVWRRPWRYHRRLARSLVHRAAASRARRIGLVPNHRRVGIYRRHAHNIARRVRARRVPPRKRVELNVVDWKQTRLSTVKGGDTVGSLFFTDIGPGNDDTLACECVPVEASAGVGPAPYLAIGTARNRRRGREVFCHREFLKLRFLVNDAEGAISDLPNGVCRVRLIIMHVFGDRQRTFVKDGIPFTEIFKDFTTFGMNSPYHSKRDVLVDDAACRLNYKMLVDKVYTLRPSMAGAPQDERHTFNVMLPARTLSWYPFETTAADVPRYGGRIVMAVIQEGGRVIQTQVAGGALPAEQACYKNIDPSVLAGTHRWKVECIGRRWWSDPS